LFVLVQYDLLLGSSRCLHW